MKWQALAAATFVSSGTAHAGDGPATATGFYAGPEAGVADHHFVVEDASGRTSNATRWGAAGGAFAGYAVPVADRIQIGGEAAVAFGGRSPRHDDGPTFVALRPRWGWSVAVRAGYLAGRRSLLFVEGGYGAHRYSISASDDVDVGTLRGDWNRSFVLGAGIERALGPRVAVRVRFQHLDGTRNQFLVGLPIRF